RSLIETLSDYLQAKQLLLVLDNCEHLIAACAELTEDLLHTCPGLSILATSREALNIQGEITWPVPPLSLPDLRGLSESSEGKVMAADATRYEAVQLFTERAASASPDFGLENHNAGAVAQICYRLDGIPLAIELAAARI